MKKTVKTLYPLTADVRGRGTELFQAQRNGDYGRIDKMLEIEDQSIHDATHNALVVTFRVKRGGYSKNPFLVAINKIPEHKWPKAK